MPDLLIFGKREAAFLRELVRNKVPFLIVGLSAANLQGAAVVTKDIDLWFRELNTLGFRKALRKVGGIYIIPTVYTPPRLAGDAVALFDLVTHMDGLRSFDEEYADALSVRLGNVTLKLLPLERIITSKRAANRPKDKLTLPVLEDAVKTIRVSQKRRSTKRR